MTHEVTKRAKKNVIRKLVYLGSRVNFLEKVYAKYQIFYGDSDSIDLDNSGSKEYSLIKTNLENVKYEKNRLEEFVVNGFKFPERD